MPSPEGCPTGIGDPTGVADRNGKARLVLADIGTTCTASDCTWSVTATGGSIGTVELSLVENGDPTFDCSQPTSGSVVCGVWTEHHSAFTPVALDDRSETDELTLALVDSFAEQKTDQSTLFDLNDVVTEQQLSVLVVITDEDGREADCARYGYDSSYFAAECDHAW